MEMNLDHCLDRTNRRGFLKRTVYGAVVTAGFPHLVPASVLGADGAVAPSNRVALGLIGTGSICGGHREVFLAHQDCRIVAVCDPVKSRREPFRDRINSAYEGAVCSDHRDFREVLARPDIDAVCIATPDHWHAIQALRAMEAGKDVYVEKPLTRTVVEGRRLVQAAADYGRILQTGVQRRSGGAYQRVCELVRNGRIGRLTNVEVGILGINRGIEAGRHFPETAVPDGFDYDLWLGPAPVAPFSPQRVARGNEGCYWYYIYDYTAGFISGNGVHFVDIGQWGIGDDIKPVTAHAFSVDCPADGLIDCPITWQSEIVYANGVKMSYSSEGNPHPDGIRFIGTEGWIHITGGGIVSADPAGVLNSVIGPDEIHLYASPGHHRNFLDGVKTRRTTAASAEVGHHATTTCNLVEISAKLGRALKWDAQAECFWDDPAADRLLSRAARQPWRL
jgi:predicted dehydrogenase